MKPKTPTTLGELKKGDRYHYPKKPDAVWQVIADFTKRMTVNQVQNGEKQWMWDVFKPKSTPVIFLRHTIEQSNSINETDELSDKIK